MAALRGDISFRYLKQFFLVSESLRSEQQSTTNPVTPDNDNIATIFDNDENIVNFMLLSDSQMDTLVQIVTNVDTGPSFNNQQFAANMDPSLNNQQVATVNHRVAQVLNNNTYISYNYRYPNFPMISNNYGSININYKTLPK